MELTEKYKEYLRNYYKNRYHTNEEFRKKILEKTKRYYAKNKKKIIQHMKDRYNTDEKYRQKVLENRYKYVHKK